MAGRRTERIRAFENEGNVAFLDKQRQKALHGDIAKQHRDRGMADRDSGISAITDDR
jgi:hypothetical protein